MDEKKKPAGEETEARRNSACLREVTGGCLAYLGIAAARSSSKVERQTGRGHRSEEFYEPVQGPWLLDPWRMGLEGELRCGLDQKGV